MTLSSTEKKSQSVLLIHKDVALLEELSVQLEARGYSVSEASDGESALHALREQAHLILLLDVTLPEDQATKLLTTRSKDSPDTPVILVSENGEIPQSIGHFDLDAFEWLSRPISVSALEHALRHAQFQIRLHEASQAHLRYLERRNVQLDVRLHELEKMGAELQHKSFSATRAEAGQGDLPETGRDEANRLRVIQAAFDSAGDPMIVTSDDGQVLYFNQAFEKVFGSVNFGERYELAKDFINPGVAQNMSENIESLGSFSCEVPMISRDGLEFHALIRATAITEKHAEERSILYIFSDISEQEQLRHQAYHDALTGVYSRRHFIELLEQNMSLSRRHGHPLSLCLADLDKFKAINDTYGHSAGDDVLKAFTGVVAEEIRTEDIAGRLGGDEFCFFFPYIPAQVATICLERIRKKFASIVFSTDDDTTFSVSVTFGISDMLPKDISEDGLIELADQSLYRAKELGRNCTVANGELCE